MQDMKAKLSTLWIFATLNYIYCDVVTLFDKAGTFNYNQGFLIGAAILVEIPIAMVLLSRLLRYKASRWANIITGTLMTIIQAVTLFVATPTPYYAFFSIIEIASTIVIVWYAWKWNQSSPE